VIISYIMLKYSAYLFLGVILSLLPIFTAKAQLTPDNTLGSKNSVVNPIDTNNDRIDGGLVKGANLFHSFQEFNIGQNRGVFFTNPTTIENILTRVTGNNSSEILGKLGVLGNANLWLINPNGIHFGQQASLDIRGSFVATTVDSIKLGENGLFSATAPATSNLLNIQPSALFVNALKNQQATINNQGNLKVDDSKNITFFSANVINTGKLTAPRGTVQLTGAETLKVRGDLETATLLLNTKNLTIAPNDSATIDKTTLESLSGNTNLIFQATNNIIINPLSNQTLNLADGSGKIAFIADVDGNGIGNFQMETTDTIKTNGRDILIAGASLTLGNIDTSLIKSGSSTIIDVESGGDIGKVESTFFTFNVNNLETPITDLNVRFSAAHTFDADLNVFLTSPQGTKLELFNQVNANTPGENFQDTLLADSAEHKITDSFNAKYPFDGKFKPQEALAAFKGENPQGVWTLEVKDTYLTSDDGRLYKAGENAIWGKPALGTQLILNNPNTTVAKSGAITLTATNGNINAINLNSSNSIDSSLNAAALIRASKNVNFNSYNGSSLHILAGGSVSINGNIKIAGIDQNNFIHDQVLLSNQKTTVDINSSTQPILDIRAGTTAFNNSGISGFQNNIIFPQVSTATNAAITVNGKITNSGGLVFLSNQYQPNAYNQGDINVNKISTASQTNNAGLVSIDSRGGITLNNIVDTTSLSKTGGNITLIADHNIWLKGVENGGDISFNNNINSFGGIKSGNIELIAGNNINLDFFNIFSDNAFRGGLSGDITLDSKGDITIKGSIIANTVDNDLEGTKGGNINISAKSFSASNETLIQSRTYGNVKAGDVKIYADELVFFSNNSQILTETRDELTNSNQVAGNGGNISIIANIVKFFNNSQLSSKTIGGGNAGQVFIDANNIYYNQNSSIGTFVASPTATGKGGDIKIFADVLSLDNISSFSSETWGSGDAGKISIEANNLTLTNNSTISASTIAGGTAGDITLNTATLEVANGGKISAATTGKGNGGTITINAPNTVNVGVGVQDSSPVISVETSGAGKAGDITINTPDLTISDTARITATATATVTNTEGGGSIILNASKINLAGIVGVFAETQGEAPAGTLQLNPYENQPNLDITLFPNSTISASTSASGKGGDLIITAPENIKITGQGKLAVESTGTGNAGNIQITTQNLNITDGVKISASTSNTGKGGNININANTLTVTNGSQFITTTSGSAKAGNIITKVKDYITLDGINSGLFARTESGSSGDSGSIDIDPQTFIIKNGAGIGVNSQGTGKGGDISIQAGTLRLENQGFITAETASNEGGEINLTVSDLLLLRNYSRITATAGTNGAGGNGGNINIKTPFIIGFPNENSDITANAFQGNGGKINITTNAIFGLKYRPQLTEKSDITASSQFGLAGEVQINTPEVDPTAGLIELPTNLIDAESLIAKNICSSQELAQNNFFIIIGKGGLPAESEALISNSPGIVEWATRTGQKDKTPVVMRQREVNKEKENSNNAVIQQAQGWIITADGRVILTANAPKVTPQSSSLIHPGCH
jgi:filamentous hemagglutinin family protein